MNCPRPHGSIKAWRDGHAFFPEKIREDLDIRGDVRVPYYLTAETILLTRKKMTLEELLAELETLKSIVIRRGGEIQLNNEGKESEKNGG